MRNLRMKYCKILIVFYAILLPACSSTRITLKDIKDTWETSYSKNIISYYYFYCTYTQSGNEEPVYKASRLFISYNPVNSPYKNYTGTKGKYKLVYDKQTGKNYIEMLVTGTGKGRLNSDFKNPNYIGEKIIFEILSINSHEMIVLCEGKKITFTKGKPGEVLR